MKKIIFAALVLFGLSSQFAMAEEEHSRFYGGLGVAEITSQRGIPVSTQETGFLANQAFNSTRNENNKAFSGNVFIGYRLLPNLSAEGGYIGGGGDGFTSETTGTMHWVDGTVPGGKDVSMPFSVKQRKEIKAWYISLVGEKSLNESVKMIGRLGVMRSKTDWEQRIANTCPVEMGCDNNQYQGWGSSSEKTAALFGIGLEAKASDKVSFRFEVVKSSALPAITPKVDLVLHL